MKGCVIWLSGAQDERRHELSEVLAGELRERGVSVEQRSWQGPLFPTPPPGRIVVIVDGTGSEAPPSEDAVAPLRLFELRFVSEDEQARALHRRPGRQVSLELGAEFRLVIPALLRELERAEIIPEIRAGGFTEDEERILMERLKDLGYA